MVEDFYAKVCRLLQAESVLVIRNSIAVSKRTSKLAYNHRLPDTHLLFMVIDPQSYIRFGLECIT